MTLVDLIRQSDEIRKAEKERVEREFQADRRARRLSKAEICDRIEAAAVATAYDPEAFAMPIRHTALPRISSHDWTIPDPTVRTIYRRSLGRCECCTQSPGRELHHLNYDRASYYKNTPNAGSEVPEDLLLLCRDCHEAVHSLGGW